MEAFQELKEKTQSKLQLADHILTMTFPLFKDSHLLASSLENVFIAVSYGMSSLLEREHIKTNSCVCRNFHCKIGPDKKLLCAYMQH